jgi:heterodisulfide reductase subunit A-like polyferredoxin
VCLVGGGVAGSVTARFSAKEGFKTLLIEKHKMPRNNLAQEYNFILRKNSRVYSMQSCMKDLYVEAVPFFCAFKNSTMWSSFISLNAFQSSLHYVYIKAVK